MCEYPSPQGGRRARLRFAARLIAALGVFTFFAATAEAETVIRVGDQKGNARAALEAAGALDGVAYTIQWFEFPAAAPLLEAAKAGAIDAGTVGDAPFTFAAAAGTPIKAIEATRSGPHGLAIVVRADSPDHSFKDLVGKTIATGRGSIGHQLVLALIEANGLKPSDVQLVFLPPADASVALATGAVDAWSTWDPYVAQLEVIQHDRTIADSAGLTAGLSFFFARDDAIADPEKRAALEDFVTRLAKARRWGLNHLDDYAKTWSGIVGLPTEVGEKFYARAKIQPTPIDASVVADEQKTIDLYTRFGLIGKPLDASTIVSSIFTPAIAAEVSR
jgi:sulfonate transport system substrate-binding protein